MTNPIEEDPPVRGPLPADRARPHPARLDPGHPFHGEILAAHEAAMSRGEPVYRDPATGLVVFTARTLWDRGWCCDTGCRHCPFLPRA